MSIAEVVAAARAAVAELPLGLVDVAEDAVDDAATSWYHVTEGSPDSAREEVHALLEAAKDDLRAVRLVLRELPARVETWIAGLGGTATASPPPAWDPVDRPSMDEAIRRARSELPPPVSAERSPRTTHGKLIDADGTRVGSLVSGKDSESGLIDQMLVAAGLRRPLGIALHVELKALLWMRSNGRSAATLVQNNEPCPARWAATGCCRSCCGPTRN
ncbi:DddA-like double-stranded DNA deaminase toxin [Allokutzneria sp. NRRL B-24872]|uniref:DddA-like double-stranded DNA deaminase toxin n=1 Tax=Allokutzneria sp. NRRL B-24872 TaxID=1137961 RepID=UPI000A3607E3|nr:DddA-like double-stranded DNA deaminase toxin [Allokutzneria sp. NRRL B-24872]